MPTKLSDNTEVALPLRNLISMVAAASIATWAYFGIIERLNQIETNYHMMTADVEQNTEFRIKWPRGEMGSLPADSEQFMLIEHLSGELEKLTIEIETGKAPFDQQQKLTLDFYEKRIANLEEQIEKLKDAQMEMTHKKMVQ
mgnify:FL=1|jgi:hypothetical protein